jgi:hypothetical protein
MVRLDLKYDVRGWTKGFIWLRTETMEVNTVMNLRVP